MNSNETQTENEAAGARELPPAAMMSLVIAPGVLGGILVAIGNATGSRLALHLGALLAGVSALSLAATVVLILSALTDIRRILAERAAEERRERLARRLAAAPKM